MKKITRRSLLATAAAVAVADQATAGVFPRGGGTGGGGGLPALTATLTFPGGTPAGGPFVFDIATGTDMGSYVAPTAGFTQRCIRVRHASIPHFLVDFRPDTSGGRIEVVFWYGECDPDNRTIASDFIGTTLATYTCVIKNAGTPVDDFMSVSTRTIPYHFWGARWRFRTVQNRTILRTASQLFSENWLPPMSTTAARLSGTNISTGRAWSGLPYSDVASGGNVIVPPAPPALVIGSNVGFIGGSGTPNTNANGVIYEPFMQSTTHDLSGVILGLQAYQDAPGTKKEEGLISEWQADWIFNGTASSLNTMLQQAELAASQMNSWYLPDVATGAPCYFKSNLAHYKTGTGSAGGFADGTWYGIPADYNANPSTGTLVCNLNGSHLEGGFGYLQFALTEDPYFLEFLQYSTMGVIGYDAPGRYGVNTMSNTGNLSGDPTGASGLNGLYTVWAYPRECRNIGWVVKNVAMAWKCSPASPPSWLNSQAQFAAYSSDCSMSGKKKILDSTDTMNSVFKYYMVMGPAELAAPNSGPNPIADYFQNFEQSYSTLAFVFAHIVGVPVPTAAGQSAPPDWKTHAQFAMDMMTNQFIATNPTDQFSTAGWNRQVPLIHDLAGTMLSNKFAFDAGAGLGASFTCPVSTSTSDTINIMWGWHCLSANTWAALWALFGPATQGLATFPTQAFPGNQQRVSIGNVSWEMAAAAACKSIGCTNASDILDYINLFIDNNYPNIADASCGVPMNMRSGFSGA